MKAVVVREFMEPSDLEVGEIPIPPMAPGMIAIDVAAAGCNFFDTLIVRGKYQVKPAMPFSPGGEVAGVVAEIGKGVTGFAVGDRVMSYVEHGGFAERVNARPAASHKIPDAMSFTHAAALPIAYGTAHLCIAARGRLEPHETLLVTAAAGGVGIATIQLAKAVGARVIALAGGAEKIEIVKRAGADVGIDYRAEDWIERVREETDGRGADVIVENVGGEIFEGCTRCIAWGGRLVVCGFAGGKIPSIRTNRILLKHISLVGVHFGPMVENDPKELANTFEALIQLHQSGKLEPLIWREYPLEDIAQALADLGGRKSWGKLVMTLS